MRRVPLYRVEKDVGGYAVVLRHGGNEYDQIETLDEANQICAVLNRGFGPEWVRVEEELKRMGLR